MNISVEKNIAPPFVITISGKEYSVQFTPLQTMKAEAAIGRPLKWVGSWLQLKGNEIPKVLVAGISGLDDADVQPVLEALTASLNPETLFDIHEALCFTAWPKAMQDMRDRAEKGQTSPNVQGGDAR